MHDWAPCVIVRTATRLGEPGETPGLTRNGMGSESLGDSLPESEYLPVAPDIGTLFSRTDGWSLRLSL
jgi:hypothetical protein